MIKQVKREKMEGEALTAEGEGGQYRRKWVRREKNTIPKAFHKASRDHMILPFCKIYIKCMCRHKYF